jgi:hypothetical protein
VRPAWGEELLVCGVIYALLFALGWLLSWATHIALYLVRGL